jgi:hypothetical protein
MLACFSGAIVPPAAYCANIEIKSVRKTRVTSASICFHFIGIMSLCRANSSFVAFLHE